MFASTAVLLSLAASTMATVFVTAPIATTVCNGGQTCNIAWQDNGAAPTLAQFGPSKVSIYVGNSQQQTMVQSITTSVDVSTTSAIQFTVDPNAGASGSFYFVRFESLSLKDTTNPAFPALAFSAKFTLNGMTGTFTPAEQSQIDGVSTAPIGGSTAASASTTPGGTVTKTTTTSSKPSSTSSTSSTAKPTSGAANGAGRNVVVSSALGLVGIAAAVFGLVL